MQFLAIAKERPIIIQLLFVSLFKDLSALHGEFTYTTLGQWSEIPISWWRKTNFLVPEQIFRNKLELLEFALQEFKLTLQQAMFGLDPFHLKQFPSENSVPLLEVRLFAINCLYHPIPIQLWQWTSHKIRHLKFTNWLPEKQFLELSTTGFTLLILIQYGTATCKQWKLLSYLHHPLCDFAGVIFKEILDLQLLSILKCFISFFFFLITSRTYV